MTEKKDHYIHPSSHIDDNVEIGANTKIWHFCHLMPDTHIGEDCVLGQNVFVGTGVQVGNRVRIQNNVSVFEGVTLEDDVFCGPSCVFTNVRNPRAHISRRDAFDATRVCKGATLGANATIRCGVQIGAYSLIGAGAVVLSDVPDHGIFVGNPAALKGWACECGNRIAWSDPDEAGSCTHCGLTYKKGNSGLERS